jgi:hypothetical protein
MFRQHWREVRFWRWWLGRRAPRAVRWSLGLLALVLVLGGGFLAAVQLSKASSGLAPTGGYTFQTTVQKLVTVREHGRTVVRRVPVIRKVFLRPQTAYETRYDTRVVTAPGGTRVVQHEVVRYVPVVTKSIVTVDGKKRTVTQTKLVPTTRMVTQTNVVTNEHTVTNQTTVVNTRTETVPVTVRETSTQTVFQTVTQPPNILTQTLTLPLVTVTVTVPSP